MSLKQFLSVAALAAIVSSASASIPVPVTFGAPDRLDLGPAPLSSSTSSLLSWEYSPGQPARESLSYRWSIVSLPAGSTASIVPSMNGHVINSKGEGVCRIAFSPPVVPGPTVAILKTRTKSNTSKERTIEIDVSTGPDNGTDNNLLTLFIDISSPRGWLFAAEPVVTLSSDFSFTDIQSNLLPPVNDTSNPSLPDVTYRLSATAIPAPGAAAILSLGGLLAARRRR